jgi:Lectin C-type domain
MNKLLPALVFAVGAATSNVHAVPTQWTIASGGNDHWYEYFSTAVDWDRARALALASSFNGAQGYLVTLLSDAENRFASATAANGNLAWIGGNDVAQEGTFRWIDGPEAGQVFTYTNWEAGEPNNCCSGENYVHTNWGVLTWNDHGGPGNPNQVNGYIVEYNAQTTAVPVPATIALVLPALLAAGWASRRKA